MKSTSHHADHGDNRHQILSKSLISTIKPSLTALKNLITKIILTMQTLIESCTEYHRRSIAEPVRVRFITHKHVQIEDALVTTDSGRYKGNRVIQGGWSHVRRGPYIAMRSALLCHFVFKVTSQ